jgi:hypothetical protein
MFVYNRSSLAVILPLALLLAVALWSNASEIAAGKQAPSAASNQATAQPAQNGVLLTAANGTPAKGH